MNNLVLQVGSLAPPPNLGEAARALHLGTLTASGVDLTAEAKHCFSLQGSGVIKAGFAGDQIPKYCFPN